MSRLAIYRSVIRFVIVGTVSVALMLGGGEAFAANDGVITSLTASNAPTPGQTITINASFLALSNINNSNISYTILAPDGVTVVATYSTSPPSLNAGQTFNDSWTTTNTSFPATGTYTLQACWSPGGSNNCAIDSRGLVSTTFFSVPTVGAWLALVGVGLLAWFLWRRRADFRPLETSTPANP